MNNILALRGMSTVSFYASDLKAARAWYSQLLGIEPYFHFPDADNPVYIEFRIGDYQHELGIISSQFAPKNTSTGFGGAELYWHVDDLAASVTSLLAMGATEYQPITVRGEGFTTASVIDPFGNVLGVMYNAHYLEILNASKLKKSDGG
jgi:predicted enzyme related to lactoylglutathione lyase